MDTDKNQITLSKYFQIAIENAGTKGFDTLAFISGLDAYGILPAEVSPLLAELHATDDPEARKVLIEKLSEGTQLLYDSPKNEAIPGLSKQNPEAQSAVPHLPITEGRINAHAVTHAFVKVRHSQRSEYLKGNIEWRRKIAQDFISRLRRERLYGGGTESSTKAQEAIEKVLESPIYARTEEEAAQKIAEKVISSFSYNDLFEQNRNAARKILADAAKRPPGESGEISVVDTIADFSTTGAVESVSKNRTLEDTPPVFRAFNSASSPKEVEAAKKTATIYASVTTRRDQALKPADTATVQEFTSGIIAITNNPQQRKRLNDKIAVDDFGKEKIEGAADEFITRNAKYTIKGKVTKFTADAYTPKEDFVDYLAAEIRHDATGTASPEKFAHAMAHPAHFEFQIPELFWLKKPGEKKQGFSLATSIAKKGLKEGASELGTKILLQLGVKTGSKLLAFAPVVGWVATVVIAFSGTIKKIGGAALEKFAAGGLASVRAAGGAFSSVIQNMLGTNYRDPNESNSTMLALALAVSPFLMVFMFLTMIRHSNIAQFFSVGILETPRMESVQPFNISISSSVVPGGIPENINYTINISPLSQTDSLTLETIKVCFSVYGSSKIPAPDCQSINPSALSGGSFSFTMPAGQQFNNSVISATITATGSTTTQQGLTATAFTTTVIGNPVNDIILPGVAGYQPGGWCNKDGPSVAWNQSDWGAMLGAVSVISQYPHYLDLIRRYNPAGIPVYRINWSGTPGNDYWGCTAADTTSIMFIYNHGISHATYILTHELGHRIASSPWFCEFKAQGISSEGLTEYAKGETYQIDEDFAESFALFVTNGLGNLPRHYNFVQQVFGLIPSTPSAGCATNGR